jgi:hypothetical protein
LEFLEINGYEWEGPDHAAVAEIFCSVIEGDVSDGQFVSMFSSWVRPLGASDMDMSPE